VRPSSCAVVPLAAWALAGALFGLGLAFVLPPAYVATVAVLEAPRAGGGSALDQLGIGAEALGLKIGGAPSSALTYPDILRSRRLLDRLLARPFTDARGHQAPLADFVRPGAPSPQRAELAVRQLRKQLDIALDRRTNLLRLSVTDRDPILAAAIANAACAELQDLVVNAMLTQAGANRRFVERQLAEAKEALVGAETRLEAFREGNLRFGNAPRLQLQMARLARELRVQEEVVLALTRQFEMAKVEERRDVPVLNVLDPAEPPAFRSSPRRMPLALAGLLLGLAVGAAFELRRSRRAGAVA